MAASASREILRELDPPAEADEPGPVNWVEVILDLVRDTKWTFDAVGNLTISQWRGLRGGVNAFCYRCDPRPGESLRDTRERERKLFAPDPDPQPES